MKITAPLTRTHARLYVMEKTEVDACASDNTIRQRRNKMEEIKTENVDFVKEFQEYLSQQTQHVNMISGSICKDKDTTEQLQDMAPTSERSVLDPPSIEVSLQVEDVSDVQLDGLERTSDGKYKCSYCSYANKGMARLIEHTRIHTGEKPHRCQLCPFASAYERHLEAHMRSHTGEKPYKCDLCAFRCSDRSNLSHHRRRRHKLLPTRAVRSPFANKRVLSTLQKRTGSLGYGRRLLINASSPPSSMPRSDYFTDLPHNTHHLNGSEASKSPFRSVNGFRNSLDQMTNIQPDSQTPSSPDRESLRDEKPILIQQVSSEQVATCSNSVQTSPLKDEHHTPGHKSSSPVPSCGFEDAVTGNVSDIQASAPTPTYLDPKLLHKCRHCDIYFSDNILFTIHMGCHGFEHPFQCNVCGHMCLDKYNFACHFAQAQHRK